MSNIFYLYKYCGTLDSQDIEIPGSRSGLVEITSPADFNPNPNLNLKENCDAYRTVLMDNLSKSR